MPKDNQVERNSLYSSDRIRKTQNDYLNINCKIWIACCYKLKADTFFLSRNYWGYLNHHLMSNTWEKVVSILAGNLNSGLQNLITTIFFEMEEFRQASIIVYDRNHIVGLGPIPKPKLKNWPIPKLTETVES